MMNFVDTPELVFRREVVVSEYISRRPWLYVYVAIVWSGTPLVLDYGIMPRAQCLLQLNVVEWFYLQGCHELHKFK